MEQTKIDPTLRLYEIRWGALKQKSGSAVEILSEITKFTDDLLDLAKNLAIARNEARLAEATAKLELDDIKKTEEQNSHTIKNSEMYELALQDIKAVLKRVHIT